VTIKVYVPAARFEITTLEVAPVADIGPGVPEIVQIPEGKPVRSTLPVLGAQPGCVVRPIPGAVGVAEMVTEVVVEKDKQPPMAGVV
jgi:hypothetical protein